MEEANGGFYSDELPDFFSKPKNYHFKSKLNYYPITQAAFLGETEVVSNLIKLGVDLDARGDLGRTALHEAVSNGYFDIVKLLVESGAGNDSNLLIVFYVQIMPDDFVMQLHRF